VALGCGNFGGIGSAPEFFGQGISHHEAFAIMDRAWASGIRWFDTADAYGGGTSEAWIGEWCHDRNHAPTITTKVFHSTTGTPGDTGLSPGRIRRQVESSLERLRIDRIDLYLAHEPDPATPIIETIATFETLRSEGMIATWGLSNYADAELEEAVRHGQPALVQNSFSLLDRADDEDAVPFCAEHGIAYVPYGPLSGGWLTGKYKRGEPYPEGSRMTLRPEPYERLADDRVYDGLDKLREEADARVVDVPTLAFAWVLARVDGAVCGPNTAQQLDPILAARELELPSADVERIGGFFE
jgi:aryl-alcohol dehydrogenase-like predicted oxidoreductase